MKSTLTRIVAVAVIFGALIASTIIPGHAQNGGYITCPGGAQFAVSLNVPEPYLNSPGDHAVGILRAQYVGGGGFIQTATMTLSIFAPGNNITPVDTISRTFNLLNYGSTNVVLDFKTPCSPTGSYTFKGSVATTGNCSPTPVASVVANVNPNALCQP